MATVVSIIQIGDIHFSAAHANPVVERANQIAAAVAADARDAKHLLVLVPGDVAQAGKPEEYEIAIRFFDSLRQALREQRLPEPLVIGTAGNHDCDHTRASQLRKSATDRGATNGRPDSATLELALQVQIPFRDFAKRAFAAGTQTTTELVRYHSLLVGEKLLTVTTVNAAWCSQNPEAYGGLWLPEEAVKAIGAQHRDLGIVMLHYPLQWYDFDTRKALRKTLNRVAHLVLTGHEHDDAHYSVHAHEDFSSEHIESGALQALHSPDESRFHLANIDVSEGLLRHYRFSWSADHGRYVRDGALFREARLLVRKSGPVEQLSHTPTFDEFLDDLGVPLSHPNHAVLHLSDLFVFPDLDAASDGGSPDSGFLSSEAIVASPPPRTLITGPERSGKTSLAKQVVRKAHEKGQLCLWFNTAELGHLLAADLNQALAVAISKQYGDGAADRFLQLPPAKKLLIVDDLHTLDERVDRHQLLTGLENRFGTVVLFANDEWASDQVAKADKGSPILRYETYRLLPLGPKLRSRLISKWIGLTPSLRGDPQIAERRAASYVQVLEQLLGRDLVPPWPSILLIMLQTWSVQGISEVNYGSLGHTYQALIVARLSAHCTVAQTNMRLRYLSELAWHIFGQDGAPLAKADVWRWNAEYAARFNIDEATPLLLSELKRAGLLEEKGGDWHFRHKYVYFYFVAEHLAQNLHDPTIAGVLASLVLRLHNEDASNIFVFVAFKTKNPLVLSMLLERARTLFGENKECDIGEDCARFDALANGIPRLVLDYARRDQINQEALDTQDAADREDAKSYAARDANWNQEEEGDATKLQRLTAAVRMVTVLGQVVRNHAGQLEAARMAELVGAAYSLSLRMLTYSLSETAREAAVWVPEIVNALKERDKAMSLLELQTRVARQFVFWVQLMCTGILKHAAVSVGMGEMIERTLESARRANPKLSVDLIDIAIALDRAMVYPRERVLDLAEEVDEKPFAKGVLRLICLVNFYLFRTSAQDRQAVCQALGIDATDTKFLATRVKYPGVKRVRRSPYKLRDRRSR